MSLSLEGRFEWNTFIATATTLIGRSNFYEFHRLAENADYLSSNEGLIYTTFLGLSGLVSLLGASAIGILVGNHFRDLYRG